MIRVDAKETKEQLLKIIELGLLRYSGLRYKGLLPTCKFYPLPHTVPKALFKDKEALDIQKMQDLVSFLIEQNCLSEFVDCNIIFEEEVRGISVKQQKELDFYLDVLKWEIEGSEMIEFLSNFFEKNTVDDLSHAEVQFLINNLKLKVYLPNNNGIDSLVIELG